jgi:G3E family GTPase
VFFWLACLRLRFYSCHMQAVHMLFEGSPERPWRADEPRVSRMVFIGREMDEEAFREAFRRCLFHPEVQVRVI